MAMETEEWQKVEELLDTALGLEPAARRQFLDELEDPYVRREVESLLACEEQTVGFLAATALAFSVDFFDDGDGPEERAGQTVGRYRIIREIGRGGMGAVFLAERSDGEFQQRLALKIVRRSFADSDLARRFRQERQILASLNHPNIARLLDGGVSNDGEPFLGMEYVEGVRIDEYCDASSRSTEERLRLFLAVCQGVSYAHQNLVVDRDIKPSNILVTDGGVPKLLDFGIAKLTNPDAKTGVAETVTGLRAMTPDYASPEQVRGLSVTTATDVYSLGVLLYELLTGQRPHRLKDRRADEIMRIICEEEPERPSDANLLLRLAEIHYLQGAYAAAEKEAALALDLLRRNASRNLTYELRGLSLLSLIYAKTNRRARAAAFLREALRLFNNLPNQDKYRDDGLLSEALAAMKREAEARSLLLKNYEFHVRTYGEQNPQAVSALHRLEQLGARGVNLSGKQ